MTSKLNRNEFRIRLEDTTSIGLPRFKFPNAFFALFSRDSKCFYGNFDSTHFEITLNANAALPFYVIKGFYRDFKGDVEVKYTIQTLGKYRLKWIQYFPIAALLFFNSILYFLAKALIPVYFAFNAAIVVMAIVSRLNLKWQHKKLERKFIKTFEIIPKA